MLVLVRAKWMHSPRCGYRWTCVGLAAVGILLFMHLCVQAADGHLRSRKAHSADASIETNPPAADEAALPQPQTSAPPSVRLVGGSQDRAFGSALPGTWTAKAGKRDITLWFDDDGRYSLDGVGGTYSAKGKTLALRTSAGEVSYDFDVATTDPLSPLVLTLSAGDLSQPVKFSAQRASKSPGAYFRETLHFFSDSAPMKVGRLLAVVLIVIGSRLIITCLRWLSHFIVYSEYGPLKYAYRYRKNRTTTIHLLALNIVKYVVYFGALGRILNELGVNYTAYFASLSVVGLAIGFGSQGLVQDIVTGFFVIFEGQFDVGDMVEISGQTGVVEEVGLRMTRLRNYLGQTVTIPNRNIALVGTYARGAMRVCVDAAVANGDAAVRAKELLARLGGEVAKQYDGIVLLPPSTSGPLSLASGEHFVRLETGIWPQQQWVIEQQLIPRLRELYKQEGIEIPGDRVSACYYMPKDRVVALRAGSVRKPPTTGAVG